MNKRAQGGPETALPKKEQAMLDALAAIPKDTVPRREDALEFVRKMRAGEIR